MTAPMGNEQQRFDVLAVMDEVLADMARDGLALDMHYESIDQARVAVAELIEFVDGYVKARRDCGDGPEYFAAVRTLANMGAAK